MSGGHDRQRHGSGALRPIAIGLVLALASVAASDAHAAKGKKTAAKNETGDATPRLSTSAPAPAAIAPDEPIDSLLKRARAHYDNLDYDQVIPLANAVLARPDPSPDQKLDAYLLQGSALAIVGDSIEAEKSFRLLLRGRPEFDLPPQIPPKIVAIFRKVQVEERTINDQLKTLQRERIRNGLALSGDHPTRATGGYPLAFNYRLRDPGNAVDELRIHYRRQGEVSFSSLALKRDTEGAWRGAIPGGWTSSEKGFELEFYLVTADREGPLLTAGSEQQPVRVRIAPGTIEQTKPPPLPLWSFLVVSGAAVATVVAASGTGFGTLLTQQDYREYAALGTERAIDGSILNQKASTGRALATTTNVLWISGAVVAVAAAVMTPFVDWSGRRAE